ncbi:RNA ligase RtcB family protein [Roseibium sediminicola]|uniref:3'-phosphate/5'-hydroxy nucleic acid ligase n=1 Tax=Roseibium sediminicola TaxID=2933272 RepID=A0ABT0H1C9_9HYPH|nr:RNA ligase RtcB family protein [Roseibium sp. CAU 1639]MCK7615471.1 RNA ligase RtcB family protein [Roseibium sp. CAU 1639]
MGTSEKAGAVPANGAAPIQRFYSDRSWIEGAAEEQLTFVAGMAGVSSVAAFPDLHPGKYGPVGSAILADRIYPQLIGNDIGCGMSLYALDLPARKLRLDKAAAKLRQLEGVWTGNAGARLAGEDLPTDLHNQALGTIGGGNHFCELQVIDEVTDGALLEAAALRKGDLVLLVHSGSRSLGTAVFGSVLDRFDGLDPNSPDGKAYRAAHDQAVRWAALNRELIAERAAKALRCDLRIVADAPHNLVEDHAGGILHRKGAARVDQALVPLAGSRDALSYLLAPCREQAEALASLAHGAGRKYDRRSMTGRAGGTRSDRDSLGRTSFGGLVVCEDRQLLIEEAPAAYKDPAQVLKDLQSAGLAAPVAALKPLVTYKKAVSDTLESARQDKRRRLWDRRAKR